MYTLTTNEHVIQLWCEDSPANCVIDYTIPEKKVKKYFVERRTKDAI